MSRCARVMRRLVLALLLALSVAAPAQAAGVGVNLPDNGSPASLDAAAAAGARYVRVFARRSFFQNPVAYNDFAAVVRGARDRGMRVVFVLTGAPDGSDTPPADPADFAAFAGRFAAAMAGAGGAAAYEVWNEEDEPLFWLGGGDPARYAALIKATYPALKAADPGAKVLFGPLTGNNYAFLHAAYDNGAGGSFDGVAVHTDTACLQDPPDSFYRENGLVARFSFLGFRTVHDVMAAHGDGEKPVWMTELGWSTAGSTCARGQWAGQKPAGVSEQAQAANLRLAYHCLAGYQSVDVAMWFTLADLATGNDELDHYGLLRRDGSRRPAWDAFHSVATRGDTLSGPCGDFDGPAITIKSPSPHTRYAAALTISAVATDATSVHRITFLADGRKIRNYTGAAVGSGKTVRLEWQGSKRLAYGRHTITVVALDRQRNVSRASVGVVRVDPGKLGKTLRTRIRVGRVRVLAGRTATVSGRVIRTGQLGLAGKVRVFWERRTKGRWKTIHGGLKPANKRFRFTQRLAGPGTWRVKIRYLGVAPYKGSTVVSRSFKAR
jgi:Bacterial Ig domain